MLVVFGTVNMDMVFPVPALPAAGDTLYSEPGWTHPGGKGANQAIAAARDGARVRLVGTVGDDALGDSALAGLAREGVRTRGVARHGGGSTGRTAVCVAPNGLSAVVTDTGANREARASQVADAMLGPRTTLLAQLDVEAAETAVLVARARQAGARIILNLSPPAPIATDALRMADLLVGTSSEMAWLGEHLGTGNNPASLRAALGVDAVRMLGVQGAEAAWRDGFLAMAAHPVDMRDTTGAADCFVGVLAAALDRGTPLPAAMRRAGVAAALAVTQLGAASSFPHAPAIDDALRNAPEVTSRQPEIID